MTLSVLWLILIDETSLVTSSSSHLLADSNHGPPCFVNLSDTVHL